MKNEAIKTGMIFVAKWGYDQTNVTFYKVTKATAKTVTIVEVASKKTEVGDMNYKAVPDESKITGDPIRRTVKHYGSRPFIKPHDCEYAELWDGQAQAGTSYA